MSTCSRVAWANRLRSFKVILISIPRSNCTDGHSAKFLQLSSTASAPGYRSLELQPRSARIPQISNQSKSGRKVISTLIRHNHITLNATVDPSTTAKRKTRKGRRRRLPRCGGSLVALWARGFGPRRPRCHKRFHLRWPSGSCLGSRLSTWALRAVQIIATSATSLGN